VSKDPVALLQRIDQHLRAYRSGSIATDDQNAFHAFCESLDTVDELSKQVRTEQSHLARQQREQVRAINQINRAAKRRLRQANPVSTFDRAA
jgi:hypothetical protein